MKIKVLITAVFVGGASLRSDDIPVKLFPAPHTALNASATNAQGVSVNTWGQMAQSSQTVGPANGSNSDSGAFDGYGSNQVEAYEPVQYGAVNFSTKNSVGRQQGNTNPEQGTSTRFELGWVNVAGDNTRVQLGAVNFAPRPHGLQIGLVNFDTNDLYFEEHPDQPSVAFRILHWSF